MDGLLNSHPSMTPITALPSLRFFYKGIWREYEFAADQDSILRWLFVQMEDDDIENSSEPDHIFSGHIDEL